MSWTPDWLPDYKEVYQIAKDNGNRITLDGVTFDDDEWEPSYDVSISIGGRTVYQYYYEWNGKARWNTNSEEDKKRVYEVMRKYAAGEYNGPKGVKGQGPTTVSELHSCTACDDAHTEFFEESTPYSIGFTIFKCSSCGAIHLGTVWRGNAKMRTLRKGRK